MSEPAADRVFSRRTLFGGLLDRGRPPATPRRSEPVKNTVARLRPTACIAFRGTLCTTCIERCPVPGAIELDRGRPKIVEDHCTGCGDCIAVCPAPGGALVEAPRP